MHFSQKAIDLIAKRYSCRTYSGQPVEPEKLDELRRCLAEISGRTELGGRIVLLEAKEKDADLSPARAGACLAGVIDREEKSALWFGYYFEMAVLKATDLGLATCWMGGSFNKPRFERLLCATGNEIVPIVSPVGYPAEKRSFPDRIISAMAGSKNRRPWAELFFDERPGIPLSAEKAGGYSQALEGVRQAPSAMNRQPWRVLHSQNRFLFCLERTPGLPRAGFDMQMNDIGIAMCHFELVAREGGLCGRWDFSTGGQVPARWEYVAAWEANNERRMD